VVHNAISLQIGLIGPFVADLDQPLAGPTIELTPDVALPNPVELIGDVDHEPITDVLENTLDPALEPPQNDETVPGATDSFLPQNLDGLELPSIDITGTEHHDGFNTLFEQSAAAEAEAHGHGDEGEGVAQFDEHPVGRIGEPASGIVEGAGEDKDSSQGGEGSNRASGQTGQEPYLMTLANAAEVASDVPHFDTGSLPIAPVVNRKKRSRTSSAVPEQDSVWKHIWLDLKTDLQELPEIDDETGGLLVGELLVVQITCSMPQFWTKSLPTSGSTYSIKRLRLSTTPDHLTDCIPLWFPVLDHKNASLCLGSMACLRKFSPWRGDLDRSS
jgi:hypothetical protein